jgi:N-acetylmuramoyl-L-alanine amidase
MKKRKHAIPLAVLYLVTVCAMMAGILWGSRAVTVLAEKLPIPRKQCFIIDAGHGGEDGGATSCTGVPESCINLEIALRLDDLMHLLGYDTCMIRSTDTSIYTKGETIAQKKVSDLKERVRIVNETEGAILLSIHQNNFPDGRYSGAQVFYSDREESYALAQKMQAMLVSSLNPGSNRKAKKAANVYLMERITSPGVLIECGFLSNAREEALLRNPEYQRKLCCVIAAAAVSYANT